MSRPYNQILLEDIAIPEGIQTGPFGSQLKAEEYVDVGIPVVMPKDILGGFLSSETVARISETKARKLKKHKIISGDIIFPRRGDLRRIGVARDENNSWICGSGCLRARMKNGVFPGYLHQYLQLDSVGKWLERNALGQTMLNLNTEIISKMPITLPPLPEQKAIADLLSTWDEAIEKTERLIQAKGKKFQWLLRKLISEPQNTRNTRKKVRLGDLFGKEINVEKGKALTKKSIIKGDIPVVAGGQTYAYFTNRPTHTMPTITVSASGAYAGFVWYHDYPIWASDCNVLYSVEGATKFLYFTLKSIQHKIYALQSGGAQPHVYSKDMKNLRVFWPLPEEQEQIAEALTTVQHEIDLLKQLADKYKAQKRGLMQKMLTGEWRIKPEIIDQHKEV
ncbi:MAG: restriction endonuclease subunit S [Clostridiaceae bacterium]|nr:restriction endonuclease subunit S [Clostridiaceae bacterium]